MFSTLSARGRSARCPYTEWFCVIVQSVWSLVSDLDHDLQWMPRDAEVISRSQI